MIEQPPALTTVSDEALGRERDILPRTWA